MFVTERRSPGEAGIWVLILGELFIFSIFFVTIALNRIEDPDEFSRAQATLNHGLGLLNTLLLLTSSLFVALAVHRIQEKRSGSASLLYSAIACGSFFVGIKVWEYAEKISAGVSFGTSDYFTLYFAFTGIHLAHVLIGLVVLSAVCAVAKRHVTESQVAVIECGGIFWHLVDLLWILLFALFYLIR